MARAVANKFLIGSRSTFDWLDFFLSSGDQFTIKKIESFGTVKYYKSEKNRKVPASD